MAIPAPAPQLNQQRITLPGGFQPQPIGPGGIRPPVPGAGVVSPTQTLEQQLNLDPALINRGTPITPNDLSPDQLSILQNDPGFRAALAQDPGFIQRQFIAQNPGASPTPFANAFTQQVQDENLNNALRDQQAINLGLDTGLPPTGLIGSEIALSEGLQSGIGSIQQGTDTARGDITGALAELQRTLSQTGAQSQGMLNQARGDVRGIFDQAVAPSQQFVGAGQSAQQQNAALSGALGPEAQRLAFQNFQESPGQAFLRERGDRAVTRNASAIGGLGGGRVMQELQRQGQGLALQDLSRQQDVLGQLTGQGLQAAGQVGSLRGQQGGIFGQLGQAGADINTRLGLAGAQAQGTAGLRMADLASDQGFGIANLQVGTGGQLATGRAQTGRDMSQNIGATTSALSDLAAQGGAGVSDITGAAGGNLANILNQLGSATGMSQEQLAGLLGNIAIGEGASVAGQPSLGGLVQPDNTLANIQALSGAFGGILNALPQQQPTQPAQAQPSQPVTSNVEFV